MPAKSEPAEETVWACVTTEGSRTACPLFESRSHEQGLQVECPRCGSRSVRRADPATEPVSLTPPTA